MSQQSPLPQAESGTSGTVLVTGGAGFLGSALVRELVARGVRVRVLVRRAKQAEEQWRLGAEPILGDVADRSALEAGLDGVSCVYHLAGKLLEPGEPPEQYRCTHVEGTQLLLECARQVSSLRRFVHCSTTGVLGPTGDKPADEEAPMRPSNVYEATKSEAELAVRAAIQLGLPGVIVRPGLVYGPGDWHLLKFYDAILRRQFRPIGRREVWLHPIYIDDMTHAFVRCASESKAVGECLNVAGQEVVSLAQLADTIARAGGTFLPVGRIPLALAWVAALTFDALPARLRQRAPLTRDRLDFLTHSRVYDVEKAFEILNFRAKTDLVTGVGRTMAWYLESTSERPPRTVPRVAVAD
ncbi:MAG TPA: NAD-dependent epimerase/dehydratase family protein [Acidimicrobiales bacterium]